MMRAMPRNKDRRFKGYVAIDEWKQLLWGSFTIRKEDTAAKFKHQNPDVEGHERQPKIVPVTIHVHEDE